MSDSRPFSENFDFSKSNSSSDSILSSFVGRITQETPNIQSLILTYDCSSTDLTIDITESRNCFLSGSEISSDS